MGIKKGKIVGISKHKNKNMTQNEKKGYLSRLTVKLQHRIQTKRCGNVFEASCKYKLKSHNGQTDKAQPYGKLHPERPCIGHRT